jgi:acetyl-CoA synthetase
MQQTKSNQNESNFYFPDTELVAQAHVKDYETLYRKSMADPQSLWAERAAELEWYQPWEKVLDDSNPPFYKWFVGGKTNINHNALDRICTPTVRINLP